MAQGSVCARATAALAGDIADAAGATAASAAASAAVTSSTGRERLKRHPCIEDRWGFEAPTQLVGNPREALSPFRGSSSRRGRLASRRSGDVHFPVRIVLPNLALDARRAGFRSRQCPSLPGHGTCRGRRASTRRSVAGVIDISCPAPARAGRVRRVRGCCRPSWCGDFAPAPHGGRRESRARSRRSRRSR